MTEDRRFEAWLFLGALGLRLLWILDLSRLPFFDLPTSDSLFYARQAALIAGGELVGTELSYPSSPLYPYLVAPFFLLSGRMAWWCLYLAQAVLDAGSAVLLRRTGSALFGLTAGRMAGLAWAGYGLAVFMSGDLMEATAAAFLANLFMYLMVGRTEPHAGPVTRPALPGLALGLACLLRPHFLPVAALAAGTVPFLPGGRPSSAGAGRLRPGSRARAVAAFLAGLALPLGLSLARNLAVSGELILVSPYSGLNAYLGNHRDAPGTLRFPPGKGLRNDVDLRRAARVYPETIEGRPLSEREVSAFWWRQTTAEIAADPISWAGLMAGKMRLFWSSKEVPNHLDFYFFREGSVPLAIAAVPFGLMGTLGLAGALLVLGRRLRAGAFRPGGHTVDPDGPRAAGILFVAIATLAYAGVTSAFFIGDRFRLPVTGWITILAAGTVSITVAMLRSGSGTLAASWMTVLALLGVSLYEPVPGPHGAREHVLVAASLEGRERLAEAERLYRRAVDLDPGSAVARYNLGRFLARTGRISEAVAEAARAADLAPAFAPAHVLLGDLSLRSDPPAAGEARRHFEEALRLEPYGADADRIRASLATVEGPGAPDPAGAR